MQKRYLIILEWHVQASPPCLNLVKLCESSLKYSITRADGEFPDLVSVAPVIQAGSCWPSHQQNPLYWQVVDWCRRQPVSQEAVMQSRCCNICSTLHRKRSNNVRTTEFKKYGARFRDVLQVKCRGSGVKCFLVMRSDHFQFFFPCNQAEGRLSFTGSRSGNYQFLRST